MKDRIQINGVWYCKEKEENLRDIEDDEKYFIIMATRSTVKIEGITFAKMYKHWDGQPQHMLPWLEEFNRRFTEIRGEDPEYKFAQLLRSSTEPEFKLDTSKSTGYGIIPYNSTRGEEYEYTLHNDGTVSYKTI
jgi:hypothetical protein